MKTRCTMILLVLGVIGWWLNIWWLYVDFAHAPSDVWMDILRIVGIWVPPLGAVLGFFP